jgi:hypothetical protein
MDQEFAKLRRDIRLLTWMAGANLALTVVVFIKVFVG